jgi:predicted  nucleic acid-binding Zn-ribbon protein
MTVTEQLLQVQAHDTHLDQLRHRRDTLPERGELTRHRREIAAFDAGTADVQSRRDAIGREQKRVEDEVALVEAKAGEVDTKLYSGTVTSPRELQGFQDDLQSLRRRQRQLEDDVLGFMEQLEPLDVQLAARAETRAELEAQAGKLEAALAEVEQAVDAEIAAAEAERAAAVASIPSDLVERYDRLRKQHDGVAIAPLVGNNCGGCHLTLSAMEVDRIKHQPADVLIYCEECGRLLVR